MRRDRTGKSDRVPGVRRKRTGEQRLKSAFKSELAGRIREALQEHNIAEIADRLALSRTALYEWQSAKAVPDMFTLLRLAKEIGCSAAWLATGDPLSRHYVLPESRQTGTNPALAFRQDFLFSLGVQDRKEGAGTRGTLLIEMTDDSMEPTIGRGDLLLVNPTLPCRGGLVALDRSRTRQGVEMTIRRVQIQIQDGVIVSCDNRSYPAETITSEDLNASYFGSVIWRGSRV